MSYDARAARLPVQALFDLRGDPVALVAWGGAVLPALPDVPNSRTCAEDVMLCHLGPRRWLLRAPPDRESALTDALRPETAPPEISLVRISDTLAFFRITGPEAAEVMAICCPMDLHPSVFDEAAASHTEAFGLRALVMRCADGFDLAVEQSFGAMLEDCLARAIG